MVATTSLLVCVSISVALYQNIHIQVQQRYTDSYGVNYESRYVVDVSVITN